MAIDECRRPPARCADDRDVIARAIATHALTPSPAAEEGKNGWVDGDYNWNQVCHGGLTVGALAIAERGLGRLIIHLDSPAATTGRLRVTATPDVGSSPR
jgi:hypothetical protein